MSRACSRQVFRAMSSARVTPTAGPSRPVVAVCGTTGVGKSQLAVTLAESLSSARRQQNGHLSSIQAGKRPERAVVLSADSMQLYKGLDVITNKVTREEMGGVEHWGLNLITPGEEPSWELGKWCSEADKQISSMPESTLPIICGGTHYFIQHFLFPPSEISFARDRDTNKALDVRWKPPGPLPPLPDGMDPALVRLLETFWTNDPIWPTAHGEEGMQGDMTGAGPSRTRPLATDDSHLLSLYDLLKLIDPKEAARWHWRDGRKVRRSLERWWERGGGDVPPVNGTGEDGAGRKARFRTLVLWVYEPPETLNERLDRRVDIMLQNGLLREIAEMRIIAEKMYGSSSAVDHTEGVFQAIGYKEFANLPLDDSNGDPSAHPDFPEMLSRTKLRTRQYAKSQIRWMKKQLVPVLLEAKRLGGDVHIYVVPGGTKAANDAVSILQAFLDGETLPDPLTITPGYARTLLGSAEADSSGIPDTVERQEINSRQICEQCSSPGSPVSIAKQDWEKHLKSRPHQRALYALRGGSQLLKERQLAERDAKRAERERLRNTSLQVPAAEPE